jgi:Ca-activated chloride channel family protein
VKIMRATTLVAVLLATLAVALHGQQPQQPAPTTPESDTPGFRFKSGVELINVTATVADQNGRFVSGLRQEDFLVYEDDQPVTVTHFNSERVPVSLGIVIDTSGSMAGQKIEAARGALDRFLFDLLDRDDEFFLYRFSSVPMLLQDWTRDRQQLTRGLGRMAANGGTAMYDAVADALPLAARGQNRKKALLVISDGNDTQSTVTVRDVKAQIRETEVLVYAIGIDGEAEPTMRSQPPRMPMPIPFPFPGRRPGTGGGGWPRPPVGGGPGGGTGGWRRTPGGDDRVNIAALREMTDDSGGRTEIVRHASDLNPATANIADELSKQYYLGYPSSGKKDGRWHSIRVELRNRNYRVRARRGYVAS